MLLRIGGRMQLIGHGNNHALPWQADIRTFLQGNIQKTVSGRTKISEKNLGF